MERLRKAEAWLIGLEKALLVVLLSVMVVMSFSQVLLRQLFHSGLLWGDTFLRQLVLWVGFLGAGLAAAESKHFAWEAASHRPAWRLAAHAASAVITAFLVRAACLFVVDEKAAGEILFSVGSWPVPAWLFAVAIPAGFFLVFLHTVVRAAEAAGALKK